MLGKRVAFGFDLVCNYDNCTNIVIYCAPLEKIILGFNKSRNLLLAFASDQIFLCKLRDLLEFLYSGSTIAAPGWKRQVTLES
jgi:hypothetical protein